MHLISFIISWDLYIWTLDYLNICFWLLDGEWVVVLIDLDFAVPIDDRCCEVPIVSSLIFNVKFDQRIKYDWQQYALMLARIIEGNYESYHTCEPHFGTSPAELHLKDVFKPKIFHLDIKLVDDKLQYH